MWPKKGKRIKFTWQQFQKLSYLKVYKWFLCHVLFLQIQFLSEHCDWTNNQSNVFIFTLKFQVQTIVSRVKSVTKAKSINPTLSSCTYCSFLDFGNSFTFSIRFRNLASTCPWPSHLTSLCSISFQPASPSFKSALKSLCCKPALRTELITLLKTFLKSLKSELCAQSFLMTNGMLSNEFWERVIFPTEDNEVVPAAYHCRCPSLVVKDASFCWA